MSFVLNNVDAAITASVLAVTMFAAWGTAFWRGRLALSNTDEESSGKLVEAILAMLGLLLAFTFSMSLVKHEQRRQMVVTDSNSIGDFYTCAGLLDDPIRGKLQGVLRKYTEHRMMVGQNGGSVKALSQKLEQIPAMHQQMQSLVKEAVDGGTPLVEPLVNTLNALTSSHGARVAAALDRIPPSIVWLLFFAAVLSISLMGWQHGRSGQCHPRATTGFILLVSMVVWVTLDLNQPQQGWITVSQEPLERLFATMKLDEPNSTSSPAR